MAIKYWEIPAMTQPDQTSCWSTSMAWWTYAVKKVPNYREIDILGMYHHLTGSDGGLKFPNGFKSMLSDSLWGMTVDDGLMFGKDYLDKINAKSPVICGYWDSTVSGNHAVALHSFNKYQGTVWAMDPRLGKHIRREFSYYSTGIFGMKSVVFGYRT